MKKHIVTLFAILAVFAGCKKDAHNTGKNGNGTVPVSFNVGFSQSTAAFSVAHGTDKAGGRNLASINQTLAANATTMYVGVYQADGTRIYLTKQLAADANFGNVQYNLAPGTYTVVFAAGQDYLKYYVSGATTIKYDALGYDTPAPNSNVEDDFSWKDTFYKKDTITVAGTGVTQNIALDRIDASIVVNIEDAIPSNVKFIQVTAFIKTSPSGASGFSINTSTPGVTAGMNIAHTSYTVPVTAGVKNTQLAIFTPQATGTYAVSISAVDQLPVLGPHVVTVINEIASADVSDVAVQIGHQTFLSGQLFGGNGMTNTGGFQIKIDPSWGNNPTTIPFQ